MIAFCKTHSDLSFSLTAWSFFIIKILINCKKYFFKNSVLPMLLIFSKLNLRKNQVKVFASLERNRFRD